MKECGERASERRLTRLQRTFLPTLVGLEEKENPTDSLLVVPVPQARCLRPPLPRRRCTLDWAPLKIVIL